MEQTCQVDELSKPREPGITTRMVLKGIQQHILIVVRTIEHMISGIRL